MFKIVDLTARNDAEPLFQFSHPAVFIQDEIAEWLDTRIAWVLAHARKRAPANQIQVMRVTSDDLTLDIQVLDTGEGLSVELVQEEPSAQD